MIALQVVWAVIDKRNSSEMNLKSLSRKINKLFLGLATFSGIFFS